MASDAEHQLLYSKLRASFLSRHFAVSRYFRTNFFSQDCSLDGAPAAEDVLKQDASLQAKTRWAHKRGGDNPLMASGQLLAWLAVEDHLGHPHAEQILRSAVSTLGTLYKFTGNHFDGYPIRYDPTTSDRWLEDGGRPQISEVFLVDQAGSYAFCNSTRDPRHMPLRSRKTLTDLMGPAEADRYLKFDEEHHVWKLGDWRDEYFDRYRRWEVSMDELVGLIMGYFMVNKLTHSTGVRGGVQRQVNKLGDYLAEHAYLLVRPVGGLNARGATGILPALEFPMVRAMLAITGNTFSSRTNFEGAMRIAGYWNSLVTPLDRWTALGAVAAPLIAPMLTGVIATLGLAPFVPEALALAGIALPAAGIPAAIASVAIPAHALPMVRAYAIYEHRDCFDVSNDDGAQEVAAAFFLMENLSPSIRFQGWMFGSSFTGSKEAPFANNFPPFIGLTALDDADPTVRDAYLAWLTERRKHLDREPDDKTRAEGCFASAIAVLLGAGAGEEARLKELLDARYVEFTEKYGNDLAIKDGSEKAQPALDYMCGLALAWLHAKRRIDAGSPVATRGFPILPSNIAFWPRPTVPEGVVRDAQAGQFPIPISAIQNTPVPRIDPDGAALFDTSSPPLKSPIPSPVLPPRPTTLIYDKVISVGASGEVYAGIDLENGDEYEFDVTGTVKANLFSENGPDGWAAIEWDARAPLHGALDPVNAHAFCLLGRLGGYFFIGTKRPRERFLYHRACPLWLRINGNVRSGSFEVHVRVWGAPRIQPTPGWTRVPDPYDFGTLALGEQRSVHLTFRNEGGSTFRILSVSADGDFASVGLEVWSSAATHGDVLEVKVTFQATRIGPSTGTLWVQTDGREPVVNGTRGLLEVPLRAQVAAFDVRLDQPAPGSVLDLGMIDVGASNAASITVRNAGTIDATLESYTFSSPGVSTQLGVDTGPIAAGQARTYQVRCSPTEVGPLTTDVILHFTDGVGPSRYSQDVGLKVVATGVGARAELTPATVDFGAHALGAESAPSTVLLRNVGQRVLTISGWSRHTEFRVLGTPPSSVAPGATEALGVVFRPGHPGLITGEVSISSNSAPAPAPVQLRGTGVLQPMLGARPEALAFGTIPLGSQSRAQAVVLRNEGGTPVRLLAVTLVGLAGSDYRLSGPSPAGSVLPPEGTSEVRIVLTPSLAGGRMAFLEVQYDGPDSPLRVPLEGGAIETGGLVPSALDLDFGRAAVGVAAGDHTLALLNTGATRASIARIAIHGAAAADFAIVSDRCSRSVLAPGESCILVLSATPRAAGARSAGLEVDADVRASGVSLHAEGIAVTATWSAARVDFDNVVVGVSSPRQDVYLHNSGNAPLTVSLIELTGDFTFQDLVPTSMTIAPGQEKYFRLWFKPTAPGPHRSWLRVYSDAPGSPHSLELTGVAFPHR